MAYNGHGQGGQEYGGGHPMQDLPAGSTVSYPIRLTSAVFCTIGIGS